MLLQENPENKYAVGVSIAELKTEDSGNYYCKGNNSHGEETQHFQLVIVEASHKVIIKVCTVGAIYKWRHANISIFFPYPHIMQLEPIPHFRASQKGLPFMSGRFIGIFHKFQNVSCFKVSNFESAT